MQPLTGKTIIRTDNLDRAAMDLARLKTDKHLRFDGKDLYVSGRFTKTNILAFFGNKEALAKRADERKAAAEKMLDLFGAATKNAKLSGGMKQSLGTEGVTRHEVSDLSIRARHHNDALALATDLLGKSGLSAQIPNKTAFLNQVAIAIMDKLVGDEDFREGLSAKLYFAGAAGSEYKSLVANMIADEINRQQEKPAKEIKDKVAALLEGTKTPDDFNARMRTKEGRAFYAEIAKSMVGSFTYKLFGLDKWKPDFVETKSKLPEGASPGEAEVGPDSASTGVKIETGGAEDGIGKQKDIDPKARRILVALAEQVETEALRVGMDEDEARKAARAAVGAVIASALGPLPPQQEGQQALPEDNAKAAIKAMLVGDDAVVGGVQSLQFKAEVEAQIDAILKAE